MAQLVVRNIENTVKTRLRRRAQRHGRSMDTTALSLCMTLYVPALVKPSVPDTTPLALLMVMGASDTVVDGSIVEVKA